MAALIFLSSSKDSLRIEALSAILWAPHAPPADPKNPPMKAAPHPLSSSIQVMCPLLRNADPGSCSKRRRGTRALRPNAQECSASWSVTRRTGAGEPPQCGSASGGCYAASTREWPSRHMPGARWKHSTSGTATEGVGNVVRQSGTLGAVKARSCVSPPHPAPLRRAFAFAGNSLRVVFQPSNRISGNQLANGSAGILLGRRERLRSRADHLIFEIIIIRIRDKRCRNIKPHHLARPHLKRASRPHP